MLKIGHRGAAGHVTENTAQSFELALAMGVDAIEFDVRRTAYSSLAVFHDATLTRMTEGAHTDRLREMSRADLERITLQGGKKIPFLEDVLQRFQQDKKLILNIELKDEGIPSEVLTLIRTYGMVDRVIVSAFDDEDESANWVDLLWMKRKEPKLKIALLVGRQGNLWRARDLAAVYQVHAVAISHELVKSKTFNKVVEFGWLSNPGLKVLVYTVNDTEEMKQLNEMGFDGIFSDYPDRFKEAGIK